MSEDSFYRKVTKGMFFDYTLALTKKYPFQSEDHIPIKNITDFIDQWIDDHFSKEFDDEDRKKHAHNLNVLRLNRLKKEKIILEKAIQREYEFLENETKKEFPDFKLEDQNESE